MSQNLKDLLKDMLEGLPAKQARYTQIPELTKSKKERGAITVPEGTVFH
jgi:hypothetical protein